jgi:hypothetical protein
MNRPAWPVVALILFGVVWLAEPAKADPAFQGGTLDFSSYTWEIKKGDKLGPGGNAWSGGRDSVRMDDAGHLHLAIAPVENGKSLLSCPRSTMPSCSRRAAWCVSIPARQMS